MNTQIELKRYQIMESLMKVSDINLLEEVDIMLNESQVIPQEELQARISVAEQQLKNGEYKTTAEAKKRLEKWIK